MADTTIPVLETIAPRGTTEPARNRRLFALATVLCVSLLHFIVSSSYYVLGGTSGPSVPGMMRYRLVGALVAESTSLLVLWYVISERQNGWQSIGWYPRWSDPIHGIAVLVVSLVATIPPVLVFQFGCYAYAGHYLPAKDVRQMLGLGISALSIFFVLVNPFFEELIVRAYTMSEVMDLGGSRALAVLVSVALQVSYHLYQGAARSIAVAAIFTVFSIYFARTRRIFPIVIAHFCIDAYALLRGGM